MDTDRYAPVWDLRVLDWPAPAALAVQGTAGAIEQIALQRKVGSG